MKRIIFIASFLLSSVATYSQLVTDHMSNFLFKKQNWTFKDDLEENEDKAEMHAHKVKTRKIFYHNITSNEVDKEYLQEISDFDTLGNELQKINYYDAGGMSAKKNEMYDSRGNLVQVTTHNYCSVYAIECRMNLYYVDYYYYDTANRIIKKEFFCPPKDNPNPQDRSKYLSTELYFYDANGRPAQYISCEGRDTATHTKYIVDKKGMLVKDISCLYKTEVSYTYGPKHRPVEYSSTHYSAKCSYDTEGRLTEITKYSNEELSEKYSYSYSDDYDTFLIFETYFTPGGRYNSETRYVYNLQNRELKKHKKNDKGQTLDEVISKYSENGLPLESYEYLSGGVAIRMIRYEYEFYK